MTSPHLFCFGYGYTAATLAKMLQPKGWTITGTTRSQEKIDAAAKEGITLHLSTDDAVLPNSDALDGVTHIVHSIAPRPGDMVYEQCKEALESLKTLEWFGYLSTTGVYGNHDGAWVDESSETVPTSGHAEARLNVEKQWLSANIPTHIFRLPGIYGPGRSYVDTIAAGGTAQPIEKQGHFFSRCHVVDIAGILLASISSPQKGEIYNVGDNEPASQLDVVNYAYSLMNKQPPAPVSIENAALSPMGRSFWADNRRVTVDKIKEKLGYGHQFPTYREGFADIAKSFTN